MTPLRLLGTGASPGAAAGRAFLVDRRDLTEPKRHLEPAELDAELVRLDAAAEKGAEQLDAIAQELTGQAHEHGLILEAHRLMLFDPALLDAAKALVKEEGINAEWAVRRVVKQLRAAFDAIDDPYFRDRRSDVDFVGDRLVRNLMGEGTDLSELPPVDAIVVAHDLSPADALLLLNRPGRIAAILTEVGGRTSHTAIVARAMDVPAVLGIEGLTERVGKGDLLAVDGTNGIVVVAPSEADLAAVEVTRMQRAADEKRALAEAVLVAETTDGARIALRANIELVEEVESAIAHGADGVGLYRTEFLYLNRRGLPTEEEHYETYKRLLETAGGRPVTVRTFDLGGDKELPGHAKHEENPSLGLRAIRYCLAHPQVFLAQCRALWRAGTAPGLRVMIPMITGVDELRRARAFFVQAREEAVAAGHAVAAKLPLGIMVETPSAAMVADRLARESDFFSIGTNDLVQYTLAVDRGNPDVSYLYNPLHAGVLRLIERTVEAGRARGIPVSVCGEMAGDPALAWMLVALGVDELSMSGASIPDVKRLIRGSSRADARAVLARALELDDPDEMEALVRAEVAARLGTTAA